jgi:glycosyltransferase involved in cell wall biosynthesis
MSGNGSTTARQAPDQGANTARPQVRPTAHGDQSAVVGVMCDVVIPCRDEAPALPALLAKLPAGFRAVVVDNGSRDATAEVARSLGATVVTEPRPGYGAAVHAGLEAATADFVAVIDGDGSMDPAELVPLLEEVTSGLADLAVGRRRPSARGVWPWHARAGNAVVLWWLRRRIGMPLHDIAPMRVARREALLGLGVEDRRFGYPVELLQRATLARWRFVELDISYYPRAAGTKSKVSGSVRGTLRAARDFARVLS